MEFKDMRGMGINDIYAEFNKWTAYEERYRKQMRECPSKEVNSKLMECRCMKAQCEDIIRKYKRKALRKPWEDNNGK